MSADRLSASAPPRPDSLATGGNLQTPAAEMPQAQQAFDDLMQAHAAASAASRRPSALHRALDQVQASLNQSMNPEPLPPNLTQDEALAYALRDMERGAQAKIALEMAKTAANGISKTADKILNQK